MIYRFGSTLILLLIAVFLPAWVAILLGAALCFFFPYYFEFFCIGLMLDMIGGAPIASFYGSTHFYLVISVLCLGAAAGVRKFLHV